MSPVKETSFRHTVSFGKRWNIILFCTRGCAKSRPSLHCINYVVGLDNIYTTGPKLHECVYVLKQKGHLFLPECGYCK